MNSDADLSSLLIDALAETEARPAPADLRSRTVDAALAAREWGRPPAFRPIDPVHGFRLMVDEFDALVASLEPHEWQAIVDAYGWSIQGLVGHLVAVDRYLRSVVTGDPHDFDPAVEHDHVEMTRPTVAAQAGRPPRDTLADWRSALAAGLDALERLGPEDLDRRVSFHGIDLRIRSLLALRIFELWTHADDVRRATGRPLVAPDEGRLGLMTDLAVRVLPLGMLARGEAPGAGRTVRLVLTGAGGGTWVQPLGLGEPAGDPDVRIVADAVEFCRVAAQRLDPAALAATITGDEELGRAVLRASAALAA
jgi:uncharacterized protein (TIGR03083 family)